MTKKALILKLVQQISELVGIPTTREQAIKENKERFFEVDFAAVYGGYNLSLASVIHGGTGNFANFGPGRLSSEKFEIRLRAFIAGIEYQREQDRQAKEKETQPA